MEKSTPHCRLSVVRSLLRLGRIQASRGAMEHAVVMGLDFEAMVAVVESLAPTDFYKSMTTHVDHRVWQDVYRPKTKFGRLYVKLTVIDEVLIVSFKEA